MSDVEGIGVFTQRGFINLIQKLSSDYSNILSVHWLEKTLTKNIKGQKIADKIYIEEWGSDCFMRIRT